MREHLLFNNAQLGAGHELSKRSTAIVEKAHEVIKVSCYKLTALSTAAWYPCKSCKHVMCQAKRNAIHRSTFLYHCANPAWCIT